MIATFAINLFASQALPALLLALLFEGTGPSSPFFGVYAGDTLPCPFCRTKPVPCVGTTMSPRGGPGLEVCRVHS